MANTVQVRNIKLGEGIPKICVPLVGKTNEEIIEEMKCLAERGYGLNSFIMRKARTKYEWKR